MKNEIATVATGFADREQRDSRGALGKSAIEQCRLDVTSSAVLFIHNPDVRQELLEAIEKDAMRNGATLPRGVFAVRNRKDVPALSKSLIGTLNGKWKSWGHSLGTGYSPDTRLPGTEGVPLPVK